MSHDTEAAYASSEVADIIMLNQNNFFGNFGTGICIHGRIFGKHL